MKINKIFGITIFCSSLLFALLIVMPLNGGQMGYEIIPHSYLLLIAYILPIIACLIVPIRIKHINFKFISMILFISAAVISLYQIGETISTSVFIIIAIVLEFIYSAFLLFMINEGAGYTTSEIVETALLVGLAIALDLPGLKIQLNADGGSISFTMLPLFIIALRQKPLKTFISCGIVYGVITCLLDGHNFMSYPLDYLLGYGAIAFTSFFTYFSGKGLLKKMVFDYVALAIFIMISGVLRLAVATLSGMIFYEVDFAGSLVYNAAYVLPSTGACIAAILLLYEPIKGINIRFPSKKLPNS